MADLTFVGLGVSYGDWNASTNSPAITDTTVVVDGTATAPNKGWFLKVTTAGTTSINNINNWLANDFIVWNGDAWVRVSDAIGSIVVGNANVDGGNTSYNPTNNTLSIANLAFGFGAGVTGNPKVTSSPTIPADHNVVTYGAISISSSSVAEIGQGSTWVVQSLP